MPDYSDLSVLIVDPNPGMRANLHNMLSQCSITRIEYAVSAGTAIRHLGARSFDVILCEYDLGSGSGDSGQDGQQLLEDLRHHKLISDWTIFIILTSEGVYSKVVSAAELTPTDYVLKPFTTDVLMQRIVKAIEKRTVFAPIHMLIAQGKLREAIDTCTELQGANPRHAGDFNRLRAELHLRLGDLRDAELLYQGILMTRPVGWAHLGLAQCQFQQQRFEEAQQTLDNVIEHNPQLMAAYDLLARVHEAMGQKVQAKKVLEDAVAISPHMVRRLRHLGEVAYDSGDLGMAEKAFKQVVAKAKYSEFRDPEDHVNLVRALVRKGDANQASGVIRDLERSMRASAGTEACKAFSSALLMDLMGEENEAAAQLSTAARAVNMARGLSNQLKMGLVYSCLQHQLDQEASGVMLHMMHDSESGVTMEQAVGVFEKAGRHDLARSMGERISNEVQDLVSDAAAKSAQGEHRAAITTLNSALRRTPGNVPVLVATVQAMLLQLDERGWETLLGEQAGHLLERARRLDPAHPSLEILATQYNATQRKYGISTTA
ncbi:tetratricopeptide repeat protein [Massilia sp. MB5]|uniref:response regulator n=1 Tax=unclassified Massilia TaxID=2609279 RepID=UPI00067CAF0C|nr:MULTISPECIES: response regulator [unclassified Massilia]AKU21116.1 transcriptional regulator [Massilia sp. NR 4-1]UMR29297.1 tetratricopeptide repeat protein [Massilia sp. MB5]